MGDKPDALPPRIYTERERDLSQDSRIPIPTTHARSAPLSICRASLPPVGMSRNIDEAAVGISS